MDWPTHTIAFPRYRQSEERREWCGAFGHLYRCIGNCTNGVPDNSVSGNSMIAAAERVEMEIARIRMAYSLRSDNARRGVSVGSIPEMIAEVDKFINSIKERTCAS